MFAVLASHGTSTHFATDRPELTVPTSQVPDPSPAARPQRRAVEASGQPQRGPRTRCRVRIDGQAGGDLVLVLFDGESHAPLASRPVPAPLPGEVTFTEVPAGSHYVRLARHAELARRHYLAAAPTDTAAGEPVRLRVELHPLELRLAITADDAERGSVSNIPVLLRRADDPHWRYVDPDPSAGPAPPRTTDADGRVVFRGLPVGRYRIETPGFEVDAADRNRLTFELTAFDRSQPIRGRAR